MNDYRPVYPGNADAGEIEILHEEVAWANRVARVLNDRVRFPARELKEELGCDPIRTFPLGRVTSDSGQQTGVPFLLAAIVREAGARQQEATEAISGTCRYTFSALHEACVRGDIVDSFTVCAVLRLTPWFTGDRLEPPE